MSIGQIPPKEMPELQPRTFEQMLALTAQALAAGDWMQEGEKYAEVPNIVARLVEYHASLRRDLDDVISVLGRRYVSGMPVDAQLRALIADLGDCAVLASPNSMTTPEAVSHLQDLLAGTGAALLIDDAAQDVILQYLDTDIPTPADQVVEALDAITTLQNLIEGGV